MRKSVEGRVREILEAHKSAVILTALGLAINIAYMINSYVNNMPDFSKHLGGNLFDHIIIILVLPLFFTLGYFADRSRAARESLKKVLERETYISDSLQAVFYPRITQIGGYRFAARYRSVLEESELGGDFYDVFSLGGGRTALVIADVSGKGLRAAMLGAFAKSIIRADLRELHSLAGTTARISSATYHEHGPDMFVTAFIGVLDEPSGAMRYVNAGHPGPIHISAGKTPDILNAASMPLGIFPEQEYVEGEIILAPGDYLVLYTDGLYEFRGGDEATPETIADEVRGLLPADTATLAGRLLAGAEIQAGGVLNDDIAILILQRSPAG